MSWNGREHYKENVENPWSNLTLFWNCLQNSIPKELNCFILNCIWILLNIKDTKQGKEKWELLPKIEEFTVDRHTNTEIFWFCFHVCVRVPVHRELFNFWKNFSLSFPLFCVIRTSVLSFPRGLNIKDTLIVFWTLK